MAGVWEYLFPRVCVHCHQSREGGGPCLCAPCQGYLVWIQPPFCDHCGLPAPLDYEFPTERFLCSGCRIGPLAFQQARSMGTYESVLRSVISFYKYQNQPGALRELVPALHRYFNENREDWDVEAVIPVPLHQKKLKARGFDQAYRLGQVIAEVLNIPIWGGVVERVRETPSQTRLSRNQRLQNLKGAFEVIRPEKVEGKTLLVVDDVMTTGATLHEMARVCKGAGARSVFAFSLARTL